MYVYFSNSIWGQTRHAHTFVLPIQSARHINAKYDWHYLHRHGPDLDPVAHWSCNTKPGISVALPPNQYAHTLHSAERLTQPYYYSHSNIYDICMFICMCVVVMQIEQQLKHLPTQLSGPEKRLSTASFAFETTEKKMEAEITNSQLKLKNESSENCPKL